MFWYIANGRKFHIWHSQPPLFRQACLGLPPASLLPVSLMLRQRQADERWRSYFCWYPSVCLSVSDRQQQRGSSMLPVDEQVRLCVLSSIVEVGWWERCPDNFSWSESEGARWRCPSFQFCTSLVFWTFLATKRSANWNLKTKRAWN